MSKKPTVRCRLSPQGTLTISLPGMSSNIARDWFFLIADALKEKAWNLSDVAHEDAVYIESVADAVSAAVQRADDKNQENIANIFG